MKIASWIKYNIIFLLRNIDIFPDDDRVIVVDSFLLEWSQISSASRLTKVDVQNNNESSYKLSTNTHILLNNITSQERDGNDPDLCQNVLIKKT